MVIWCSWRSLVEASSDAASRWSVVGSPPRGGAGHGMGADDVAGDRHQELGAGGHQACDRDDVAARIGRPQSLEHRQPVDGPVCGDVDLAGQHDLVQGAARDGLRGPLDQCAPVVGVALRADREPLHRCQRLELRFEVWAAGVDRSVADRGDPPGAVVGAAGDDGGDDQLAGRTRRERQGPEGHRSAAGQPHLVVDLDADQGLGDRTRGRRRIAPWPRHAGCAAPAGQPGAPTLEQHPVAPGEPQQVDVCVHPAGACQQCRHDALVARMSWAMPPESRRRSTSTNPASATIRRMSSGAGR